MAADLSMSYRLILTTLSPLHVGSGGRLREGYEFLSHRGRVWVADFDQLFRHVFPAARQGGGDDLQAAGRIAETTLAQMARAGWLGDEAFAPGARVFRYSLAGSTSTANKEGELHEFIKDVFTRPYLPGSSLKGAFRSVLLRYWAERDHYEFPPVNLPEAGRRSSPGAAKAAARNIERAYFVNAEVADSKTPNYDLWRAFRAGDSAPVPVEALALAHVESFPMATKVAGQKKGTLALDFEALPAGVNLEARLSVDRWLLEDARAAALKFSPNDLETFTAGLSAVANEQARIRLDEEIAFYQHLHQNLARLLPFALEPTLRWLRETRSLAEALPAGEMLLPVGRGTGWRSKTLGYILQDERKISPATFRRIVEAFNLGKGKWLKTSYIPVTRMVATCGDQVRVPLGWVKIKMEGLP